MASMIPAPADPRVAQLLATVALFERDAIEEAVDAFIALLDATTPDPDMEDDERSTTIIMRAGEPIFPDFDPLPLPDGMPGDPVDAEDDGCSADDREDDTACDDYPIDGDSDAEGGAWAEVDEGDQGYARHGYTDDEQEEPLGAERYRHAHRDRIRATRCRPTGYVYEPFALLNLPTNPGYGRAA